MIGSAQPLASPPMWEVLGGVGSLLDHRGKSWTLQSPGLLEAFGSG